MPNSIPISWLSIIIIIIIIIIYLKPYNFVQTNDDS